MKIDYSKIITKDLNTLLDNEQFEKLKAEAKLEKSRIMARNKDRVYCTIQKRAEERLYTASDYLNKTAIERAIIIANIVFENNKEFVEKLHRGGFDQKYLVGLIRLLDRLKDIKATKALYDTNELDDEEILFERECKLRIIKITKHIQIYTGPINPEIIINKLNEIISYQPELLEINNDKKVRTK